jgi:hypothetical protein
MNSDSLGSGPFPAIRTAGLTGQAKADYRATHASPVVAALFAWAEQRLQHTALRPSNPLTKALNYALERRAGLRVYLDDPDVPIDTNHLERALRPIRMGCKAWPFCWSEVGAEAVATFPSLIVSCRLHDIDPCTSLVDVLQRFPDSPLRSDLHTLGG